MRNQVSCFVAISAAVIVVGCSEAAPSTPSFTSAGSSTGSSGAGGSGPASTTSATSSTATGSTTAASTSGAGGSGSDTTAGAGGSDTAGSGGGPATTGSAGSGGTGGSTGGAAGSGGKGGTGGSGGAGTGGAAGAGTGGAITSVVPTAGCGMTPPANGRATIQTMGTKPTGCADSKCGAWSYAREYFLYLPAGYNNMKAYPLVFQGPGCGGNGGGGLYPLNDGMGGPGNVGNTVIRVGLTPPPLAIGHATNPNDNCFDDKEGDDSVDWVFYENLWDKLATQLCFDKNRVFASGNSSGAWFSNEVGCKYAGDAVHPIRGALPNTGGLPDQPAYKPTCTTKPMAGMWIHETGDPTNPFTGNKYAIQRAMQVNGCTIGTNFDNTMFDDFPIGGGRPANTCRKIRGCPDLYPLVVCPLTGNGHGSHDETANPGYSTFLKLFSAGAFITQ